MTDFFVNFLGAIFAVLFILIFLLLLPDSNIVTDELLKTSSYTCVSEEDDEIIIKLLKIGGE